MTAPYKKRAKAGWNNDKEQSNKDERAFEKREIKELISDNFDLDDGYIEYTSKPLSKKKKQLKAKDILNKIRSIERTLDYFKKGYQSNWIVGVIARYEKELKDLNELYIKLKEKR